ncbi:MAG: rod shape-determining protein MreC [Candidatus Parcubacteria bacterium]|jgi:hypothetical protein
MKTIFHGSAKKKPRLGRRVLLSIVAVVVLFNIFDVLWPQTIVRSFLAPMVAARTFIFSPFAGIRTAFVDKAAVVAERDALAARVRELEIGTLQSSVDGATSAAVRTERTFLEQGMVVPVLVRPPFSPYDSLVLDTRKATVSVGDGVFAHGVRIGTITHVDAFSATAGLLTSPGTKTPVRVASVDGEAVGQGGGNYTITIPKDVSVTVGQAVVHPGSFQTILGVVSALEEDTNAAFQVVHVALPVAFSALDAVTVVALPAVLE